MPKAYFTPRQSVVPGRRKPPLGGVVRFEWIAIALGVAIAWLAPLSGADDGARGRLLGLVASSDPATRTIVLSASAGDLAHAGCSARLEELLSRGRARGALSLPPADELCPGRGAGWIAMPPRAALRDSSGTVVGLAEPIASLRLPPARWLAPVAPGAVPRVWFDDLIENRIPASVLTNRIVVVAMREVGGPRPAGSLEAAAIEGLLAHGPVAPSPGWLAALVAAFLCLGISTALGRSGLPGAFAALLIALVVVAVGQAALARLILLPMASLVLALATSLVVGASPRLLSSRRGVARAAELIERATLLKMQGIQMIPDPELWARVARLAEQAHPADFVLIAELPPHEWHLKFWPNGPANESLVAERRRDIRRTPYSNDDGIPTTRLVRGFLVMSDMPAVVVPLIAYGEVEGYVFLCGEKARTVFKESPERAERLGENLALLLRRRRIGTLQEQDWLRTAGMLLAKPERRSATLIEGARIALDDLTMFGSLLREAPVGLLYADSFGDVRIVGRAFVRWLPVFGVAVPTVAADGPLPPGSLPLSKVLAALGGSSGDVAPSVSDVMATDSPLSIRVTAPESSGGSRLLLSVRAVRQHGDGVPWVAGYVASLVEGVEEPWEELPANVRRMPAAADRDPLAAHAIGEIAAAAAASAARRTGRPVRMEPLRGNPAVLARRAAVGAALEEFLADCAAQGSAIPVVAIEERRRRVDLRILDVALGLPETALRRAIAAPTQPPDGLRALGRLVDVVLDSHGDVTMRSEPGWGVTIVARFLRARPRPLPSSEAADVVELSGRKR